MRKKIDTLSFLERPQNFITRVTDRLRLWDKKQKSQHNTKENQEPIEPGQWTFNNGLKTKSDVFGEKSSINSQT